MLVVEKAGLLVSNSDDGWAAARVFEMVYKKVAARALK